MNLSSLFLRQAKRDFRFARFLRRLQTTRERSAAKEWIIFCSQQAAEKAFKAVLCQYPPQGNQRWKKEHNFQILKNALQGGGHPVPISLARRLRAFHELDRRSRYPDVFKKLPKDVYTWEQVEDFLKTAGETLAWAKKVLSSGLK